MRLVYRGRDCPWKQCARCGSAIPERRHRQHTGGDCFGHPSAPGRIESPATRRAAEALGVAAGGARGEGPAAPGARRGVRGRSGRRPAARGNRFGRANRVRIHRWLSGRSPAGGSSPSTCKPAVVSARQRSPKGSRQSSRSKCTRLPSARSSAGKPPMGSPQRALDRAESYQAIADCEAESEVARAKEVAGDLVLAPDILSLFAKPAQRRAPRRLGRSQLSPDNMTPA